MTLSWIRTAFTLLALLLGTLYGIHLFQKDGELLPLILMPVGSVTMALVVIYFSRFIRKSSLRALNIVTLGLLFGYLLAVAVSLMVNVIDDFAVHIPKDLKDLVQISIYLFCGYVGMLLTWYASDEWAVSIPFIRLVPQQNKTKDILLDLSILMDVRLIDLASSGLLDCHVILPRFVLAELLRLSEEEEEGIKERQAIELIKSLEAMPSLELRLVDHDFPELRDLHSKLVHLARLLDAQILTADPRRLHQGLHEGVRFVNIHNLSNALKPIIQGGELLPIKIQRLGKEARQGVGYLEDGSMVVVNGGAEFLGQDVKVSVLSVKHTSAGRMIFCNMIDEQAPPGEVPQENTARNYFAETK